MLVQVDICTHILQDFAVTNDKNSESRSNFTFEAFVRRPDTLIQLCWVIFAVSVHTLTELFHMCK